MKTVLLLSGGVDSTVLLAQLLRDGNNVKTITFDYGQMHAARELAAVRAIVEHYGVANRVIDLRDVFEPCPLRGTGEIPEDHADGPDATVVPGRNLVFLSIGVSVAESIDAATVVIGAIRDDAAGYRDCRWEFIESLDGAARWATNGVGVCAPYTGMTKRQVLARGHELDAPLHLSWSCYRGGHQPCGHCGACRLLEEANS